MYVSYMYIYIYYRSISLSLSLHIYVYIHIFFFFFEWAHRTQLRAQGASLRYICSYPGRPGKGPPPGGAQSGRLSRSCGKKLVSPENRATAVVQAHARAPVDEDLASSPRCHQQEPDKPRYHLHN